VHGRHVIVEHIDSSQIHLWLAFFDEITDPRLLGEYQRLLSREELQRQQRFYFERDRHRYLVTRAMVRTVLSKYADVGPRDWTFAVNPYGRPSIAAERAAPLGLQFNVSHTDGLAIMGITRGRALGVDVENVRTQRAAVEFADRFFAPDEAAALRALPASEQPQRFFEYWTLKESYIKARGLGLSVPLDCFSFKLSTDARAQLTVVPEEDGRADRWCFWQLRPSPTYLAAVCAESGDDQAMRIVTRRIVPGSAQPSDFQQLPLTLPEEDVAPERKG
jgi:4'-phosphopantetheinyl transferase